VLLSLRSFQPPDAELIADWFRTAEESVDWSGPGLWPLCPDRLREELTFGSAGHFVLADDLGAPVGLFGLRLHHDRAHLVRVALAPAFRGCGYSSRLLEAACLAAAHRGFNFITLKVYANNEPAVRAYEAAEFAYIRRETDPARAGALVWWMGRSLEEFALA